MDESSQAPEQKVCQACGTPLKNNSKKYCSHICRAKCLTKPNHLVDYSRHVSSPGYNRDIFLDRTQDGYLREADMGLGF